VTSSYLDLLKLVLTGMIYEDPDTGPNAAGVYDANNRRAGKDAPKTAMTMVGLERLNSLEEMIRTIDKEHVLGDVIEAGCWRGGASIFMRAALNDTHQQGRTVFVTDSFEGLPRPTSFYDTAIVFHEKVRDYLKVSQEEVEANFAKFGLSDGVYYIKGWFKDLDWSPVQWLALLRADGDMYDSTMDILNGLYPKVSPGGFVVIDDYLSWPACRVAVTDFRDHAGITAPIHVIDWSAVYWRKP